MCLVGELFVVLLFTVVQPYGARENWMGTKIGLKSLAVVIKR